MSNDDGCGIRACAIVHRRNPVECSLVHCTVLDYLFVANHSVVKTSRWGMKKKKSETARQIYSREYVLYM